MIEKKSNHLAALLLVIVAAFIAVGIRFIPYEHRMPNFALAGALFLFVGARLRPWWLMFIPFALMVGVDLYFLGVKDWTPSPFTYGSYALYLLLGSWLLRRTESPLWIGGTTLLGSLLFFLVTNGGVWIDHMMNPAFYQSFGELYSANLAGLLRSYELGLPFFRGTITSDVLFTGLMFGAHAYLVRAYFPQERVNAATELVIDD